MRAWLMHAVEVKHRNLRQAALFDRQIERMERGEMHTGSNNVDTTAETLKRVRDYREELRTLPFPLAVP